MAAGFSAANDDFALARYNSNGSLDTTFGSGGKVTTDFSNNYDEARALAIQSDGKIVAAGFSSIGGNRDFALARYNSNGSLDTTFGSGGKVTTPIGSSHDYAYALAIQNDGKLVAAGLSYNGSTNDFAVVRYNSNGSLDTSFGSGGKVITPIGSSHDQAYALAIQSDGKLVAAGYSAMSSSNGSDNDFALARYNSNGSLDTTFGSGGKVTTPIGSSHDYAYALAIQNDGKLVAAGYSAMSSSNGSDNDFALARYNSDGTLDTSFGSGGKVITPIGSSHDYAYALAIQSDGKIVAAGLAYYMIGNNINPAFGLARYQNTTNQVGSALQVNVLNDNNGACTFDDCSLREAVTVANAQPGTDTITFKPGLSGTIILGSALPNNNENLIISGPGATVLAVQANAPFEVFTINNGVSATTISDLTFNNGHRILRNDGSGTLTVTACRFTASAHAAIYNFNGGTVTATNCTFSGNNYGLFMEANGTLTAINCTASGNDFGIYNFGSATVTNCTFNNNTSYGLFNDGTLTTTNCTVSDNTANGINNNGTLTANHCTISANLKGFVNNGTATLKNTICATNTTNFAGTNVFNNGGNNLTGGNPLLGPLQNNGGPTNTRALLPGSPAIDQASSSSLTTDQRGVGRPKDHSTIANVLGGSGSDIGAFELDTPLITINSVSKTEGNSGTTALHFTVTLSMPSTSTVTVDYTTLDNTATAPADYTAIANPVTLNFNPNITSLPIAVAVVGDLLDEANETFKVKLANATNALIQTSTGNGTIVDDDGPTISIDDTVTVTEGNSPTTTTVTFNVSLSAPSPQNVTVKYATTAVGSTAVAPADYTTKVPTTLFFPAGSTTPTTPATVIVKGDNKDEYAEWFGVKLSNPTNATIANDLGQCIISDDDAPPSISINNRVVTEGSSGSTAMVFTVSLSAASGKTVTVNYATADGTATGTATGGSDYASIGVPNPLTLTFTPGMTSQTFTVLLNGDVWLEASETMFVNLSSPVNATIAVYQGQGTILNDD